MLIQFFHIFLYVNFWKSLNLCCALKGKGRTPPPPPTMLRVWYSISVSNIWLQFFTGCDVGYYGENCSDRCYHCKNNATCGIQHGDCDDSGCVNPGKQPPRCKGLKRNRDVKENKFFLITIHLLLFSTSSSGIEFNHERI